MCCRHISRFLLVCGVLLTFLEVWSLTALGVDLVHPGTLNPYVYLSADIGVMVEPGGRVTQWMSQDSDNKNFQANHPAEGVNNDPHLIDGPVAGTKAILYDADGNDIIDSDDALQLFPNPDSPLTIFSVIKITRTDGTQYVVDFAPGNSGTSMEVGTQANRNWAIHRGSGAATGTPGIILPIDRYVLMTTEILSTGGPGENVKFYVDGDLQQFPNYNSGWLTPIAVNDDADSQTGYQTGTIPLAIGARVDHKFEVHAGNFDGIGPDEHFKDGAIAEVIIYRETLSEESRTGVEQFLIDKYQNPSENINIGVWTFDRSGDWAQNTNWFGVAPPDDNSKTAVFGDSITRSRLVYIEDPVTVQGIEFANSNRYVIGGTAGISLDSGTGAPRATVDVVLGSHEFQASVDLITATDVTVANGSTLTFNNALNLGGNTLNKMGKGTVEIRNDFITGSGGVLNVQAGVVSGNGTVGGDINNDGGTLSPGNGTSVNGVPEPYSLLLFTLGGCLLWQSGARWGRR